MLRCALRPRTLRNPPTQWLASVRGSIRGVKLTALPELPSTIGYAGSYENTGRAQLKQLLSRGIGLEKLLKKLHKPQAYQLLFKIAPQHTINSFDMRYFGHRSHCWSQVIVRRYLSWEDKPLWCSTAMLMGADSLNSVVRGKAKYRMHAALHQALRNAGYDDDGRRLEKWRLEKQAALLGVSTVVHRGMEHVAQLYGSLHIMAKDARVLLDTPFDDLRKHFDELIRVLEKELGRPADYKFDRSSAPARQQKNFHSKMKPSSFKLVGRDSWNSRQTRRPQ